MNDKGEIRFVNRLLRIFNYIFCFAFLGLLISLCFFNNNGVFSFSIWKTLMTAIITLGVGVSVYFLVLNRNLQTLVEHPYKVLAVIMVIVFLLQMIYVSFTTTNIGWDVNVVLSNALSNDSTEFTSYFSRYTNNIFLSFVFRTIAVLCNLILGGTEHIWHVLSIVNTLAVDVALVFVFLIGKRLFSIKIAYLTLGISILVFGFFPWLIVPYSDTLAMPFTVLILWLFLVLRDAKKTSQKILLAIGIGMITLIGYLTKPTVVIVLIAIIIISFLYNLRRGKKLLYLISIFAVVLATFGIGNKIWTTFLFQQETFHLEKGVQVPATHFFMMGMKEMRMGTGKDAPIFYGCYDQEDVNITMNQPSTKAMKEVNMEKIKERFANYSVFGYLKFLANKARWITSEGQFFWGGEGSFADYSNQNNILSNIIYPVGTHYNIYLYYSQVIWVLVIFLMVYPLFIRKKEERGFYTQGITLVRCTIVGIILFILLFEGRSRYFILYLPYFTLLAAYGFKVLTERLPIKKFQVV